jgi:phosphatidylglycerophosphate synthase
MNDDAERTAIRTLRDATLREAGVIFLGLGAGELVAERVGLISYAEAALAQALFLVITVIVATGVSTHRPHAIFGWANRVTFVRAAMTCAIGGLLAGRMAVGALWFAAAVALLAIVLDGVDGWIARKSGLASRFGARFDMEADAALVLALSALLFASSRVAGWVLLAGFARYLFVGAGRIVPALRAPLPASARRRMICVVQGVTLALALAPVIPGPVATALAAVGTAATLYSFALDAVWLLRHFEHAKGRPWAST